MPRIISSKHHTVSLQLENILKILITYLLQQSTIEIAKLEKAGRRVCFQNFPRELHHEWITKWANILATAEDHRSITRKTARILVLLLADQKYRELKYNWPIEPAVLFSQIEEAGEN